MGRLPEGDELSPHPASAIDNVSTSTTLAREIHPVCVIPASVTSSAVTHRPAPHPCGSREIRNISALVLEAVFAGHLHESALAEIFLIPVPGLVTDPHQGLEFIFADRRYKSALRRQLVQQGQRDSGH